jgi:hypothetical protein
VAGYQRGETVAAGRANHLERHPLDYDWKLRFPNHDRVHTAEGGAVYTPRGEGAWWLITDEGSLADLLDPVEDAEELATVKLASPSRPAELGVVHGP